MKKVKTVYAVTAALLLLSVAAFSAQNVSDETTAASDALGAARAALAVYRNKVAETPQFASLRKEVDEARSAFQSKNEELSKLFDKKINDDKAYIDILGKGKEFTAIKSDLANIRVAIESDPAILKLRQEVSNMRTKTAALEKEANDLVESKFNSDGRVKELLAKKERLADVPQQAEKIRNSILDDPEVKALRSETDELRNKVLEKRQMLTKMLEDTLKSDKEYMVLEQKVNEASARLDSLRNRPSEAQPAKKRGR